MKFVYYLALLLISCCFLCGCNTHRLSNRSTQGVEAESTTTVGVEKDALEDIIINYNDVEIKPSFQGDTTLVSFHKWVDANTYYPEDQPDAIGRIFVDFDILSDGTLSNIVITRGLCDSVDLMVKDVLQKSPKWEPGRIKNQPCTTRITGFIVIFMLR